MKYKIPKISIEEIHIIEIDNTKNDSKKEEILDFFNKNLISNLEEIDCPYEITIKIASKVKIANLESLDRKNPNKEKTNIPLNLDHIVTFKNIW